MEKESIVKFNIIQLLLIVVLFMTSGCQHDTSGQYIYKVPERLDDGLETGSLEEVNIDGRRIEEAVNNILIGRFKEVHALLIIRDNKLVLEEYFTGHIYKWEGLNHHGDLVQWDRNMLHNEASVTKSITSACMGIAVKLGYIKNVHLSIFDFLPEYQHFKKNGKEKITIEHLLTMTSGLAWDEWGAPLSSTANDIIGLWFNCEDQISCILQRPLKSTPGARFCYSGGNMILLGEIIKNATKMDIVDFSRKYLFTPLGIDTCNWFIRYPNGTIESAGGLKLTPRAMAKVGLLFLNHGKWHGKQIISEQWVAKSATQYGSNHGINIPGEPSGRNRYGYSWWVKTYYKSGKRVNMYSAGGWGGQHIMVLPELNSIVVFTGGNYVTHRPPYKMLEDYILPSIQWNN